VSSTASRFFGTFVAFGLSVETEGTGEDTDVDETSWLMAREIPRLRRYALSLVNEPEAADDLVQDTLERAIRKRGQWRRHGAIRSWLYRILYRVFLNQCAANGKYKGDIGLDDAPQLWARASQEDQAHCRDIAEAMQRLPHDQRAAIALTAVEGLSYDEAAEVLDIPIGTLRSRLSRGREALRLICPEQAPQGHREHDERAPRPPLRRVK
jgi:RNA polymerase sigma-70 factor, ECF subfamily